MYYTIYKITNKINGKYYIGKHQTANLNDAYMGSGKLLKRAIEKHGLENFTKEILHIFDNEKDMNAAEKELVVISEETYNLCDGGLGGFGYINSSGKNIYENHGKLSAINASKTIKKKRESSIDYDKKYREMMKEKSLNATKKQKEKYPEGVWKGKKHTEQTKQKLKGHTRQTGEKNSQYGKPKTEEQKQKIRESLAKTRALKKLLNQSS
jgi:hypothetical protein